MKPSELMIGDWVFNAHHGENIQITPYDFFTHGHFEDGRYIPTGVTPSNGWDLEPIPITPVILEKNGFRFVKADRMFPADRYFWGVEGTRDGAIVEITFYNPDVHGVKVLTRIHTQSSHESGINSVHSCDIESVHELQNALRLCGIKKEIKI